MRLDFIMPRLTQQQLEAHLWGAANILRGKTAGQDYKTYILTLADGVEFDPVRRVEA